MIVFNLVYAILYFTEYNHSIPSSLTGMLNHFHPSIYKHRPSGIVAYSMGPWGGMRMAVALRWDLRTIRPIFTFPYSYIYMTFVKLPCNLYRPFLGELGSPQCQQLVGFPLAHEMFKDDGTPTDVCSYPSIQYSP